jgi:hypothetical protein
MSDRYAGLQGLETVEGCAQEGGTTMDLGFIPGREPALQICVWHAPNPTARASGQAVGLGGDVKRLTNFTSEYRLRVGDYRLWFGVEGLAAADSRVPVSPNVRGSQCDSRAETKPAAFARVSSYSESGRESATIPAPTWK